MKFIEWQRGDITHTCADISKVMKLLSYKPQYTIERGVKEYILWLKNKITTCI